MYQAAHLRPLRADKADYRDVFDRTPDYAELPALVADLEVAETSSFLCQLDAELRLAPREREALAKVQTEWAAELSIGARRRAKYLVVKEKNCVLPFFLSPVTREDFDYNEYDWETPAKLIHDDLMAGRLESFGRLVLSP